MNKTITLFARFGKLFTICLISAFLFTSCKKAPSGGAAASSSVPRKPVPGAFVGTFSYTTQDGGWISDIGTTTVGVAQGITLNINSDGTGSSLYIAETGSYTGSVTTDAVSSQCTYEITLSTDGHANMIIHTVSGKDYHNNVYLHDLDASKIYPNHDIVWNNVSYGVDDQNVAYFSVPQQDGTSAKFTKQ